MSKDISAAIPPDPRLQSRNYASYEATPNRSKPRLVIDTYVPQNQSSAAQSLPLKPTSQGSSFITLHDVEALRRIQRRGEAGTISHGDCEEAGAHIRTGPHRTVRDESKSSVGMLQRFRSNAAALVDSTPMLVQGESSQRTLGLHQRIKRLRPSPLDLPTGVSPSDRAIPIGIAFLSDNSRHESQLRQSSVSRQSSSDKPSQQLAAMEATTPTIIITPAREAFTSSPDELSAASRSLSPTSWYSKYNTGSNQPDTIPTQRDVPPLPFLSPTADFYDPKVFKSLLIGKPLDFNSATNFSKKRKKIQPLPIHTARDMATSESQDESCDIKRLTSQSMLPTPLRSKGWWNVITSPFTFTPKRSAPLTRSSPVEESDGEGLLANAQRMGMADGIATLVPSSRAEDDASLRSAPPLDPCEPLSGTSKFHLKRSDTAPAALDPGSHAVNIYYVPSGGEAAAYYNPNRNFPSLVLPAGARGRDSLAGWSPSQSVFREPRNRDAEEDVILESPNMLGNDQEEQAIEAAEVGEELPVKSEELMQPDISRDIPSIDHDSGSESQQQTTESEVLPSCFSPLTPTPVSEHPYTADMPRTRSTFAARRDLDQADTGVHNPRGLEFATMASNVAEDVPDRAATVDMTSHSTHSSEDLPQGLGISSNEKAAPRAVLQPSNDTKLGTDKFGQLQIETDEVKRSNQPWYRRLFWFWATNAALLLMLLIVLLVIYIPQKINNEPVEAQWLKLTGFPPMPTGVMTIIQPTEVENTNGCVSPSSLWTCAMPPAGSNFPAAKVPSFRIEITFRNQTNSDINSTELESYNSKRSSSPAAHASALIRRNLWSDYVYSPFPAPPSTADQLFIGRTTDNNSAPYDGEETPFYISFLTLETLEPAGPALLAKRDDSKWHWPLPSSSTTPSSITSSASISASVSASISVSASTSISMSTSTSGSASTSVSTSTSASASGSSTSYRNSAPTEAPTSVPAPILQTNGEPVPASLYPFPTAQPLRLYDRGLPSEHYGFYTYFSRTLYISSNASRGNASAASTPSNITVGDSNNTITANVALEDASAVCIWSQTRMLVQIWTQRPGPSSSNSRTEFSDNVDAWNVPAANSTANVMIAPGSFPYAITISSDRHGGEASEKGIYCYSLDSQRRVDQDMKTWVMEDRSFGGALIHPAQVPGGSSSGQLMSRGDDEDLGSGVDGGAGGCACRWQNWNP